jgi:UDP-N-acetylglucosamine acyltransferase
MDPQGYEKKDINSKVIIGNKNIIRENVTISGGSIKDNLITKIGNNCLFMAYSHVAHDCILGDNIILANNVALGGHVFIENNAIIGGNSAIHQFCRIGQFAMIGGMSGLTKDIMPFTMYISHHQSEDLSMHSGIMGVNMVGLKRSGMSRSDIIALATFYNNILNNTENKQERTLTLLEKYNKYQHLIKNEQHKSVIKNFIDIRSHQGFYREMLKIRNLH